MCTRVPIKVKRTPITVATDNGWHLGKWFAFPKPDEDPPYMRAGKGRVLWCPWCGEWSIYTKSTQATDRWACTGRCGWGNTDEWYVRTYNNLWYE